MKTEFFLETKELTKDFGGLRAVNGLSIGISSREILGLIGPNGSGKTTSVNMISGIYKPTAGEVIFKGQPVHKLPPWKRAKLGIQRTFQQTQAFQLQTVLQNVVFGCHVHERTGISDSFFRRDRVISERKNSEAKSLGILELVGLAQYAHRPVASLSPGAQRQLTIGMCLASDPELLLLDEPACGLSAEESLQLVNLVRRLRDGGLTVLVIDHHMKMMMSLCDRMVVIDHGTQIAEGTPQEVANNKQVIDAYLGPGKES